MADDRTSCSVDDRPTSAVRFEQHAAGIYRRQLEYAFGRLERDGDLSAEQRNLVANLAETLTERVTPVATAILAVRAGSSEDEWSSSSLARRR